jgi:hypothetical protein
MVTNLLEEIAVNFGAITLRFLAIVEIAVNVKVRSINKDGIIDCDGTSWAKAQGLKSSIFKNLKLRN